MNFKDIVLTPLVRQLLAGVSASLIAWAVSHGVEQGKIEALLGGIAAAIVSLGWAIGERLLRRFHLGVALDLPSGSTVTDLKDAVNSLSTLDKIKAAAKGNAPDQRTDDTPRV
jgi:hypothetical protein